MLNRRNLMVLASAAILVPVRAMAATPAFTRQAFAAAQKADKPILIEIHASWCPTCHAQTPILEGLLASPKYKDMVSFRVDFDSQVADVRAFSAQSQSTLIVFKGQKETARSVGDTNPKTIEALLAAGI